MYYFEAVWWEFGICLYKNDSVRKLPYRQSIIYSSLWDYYIINSSKWICAKRKSSTFATSSRRSHSPLRLPPPHFEVSEISDLEHAFPFDLMEDSLGLFEYPNRLPLPTHYNLEEISIGDNNDVDTNPVDDLLASN